MGICHPDNEVPSGYRSRWHLMQRLDGIIPSPPLVIWIPTLFMGLLMVLPLAYLLLRTIGAGDEAWMLIFRARTVQIVWRSIVLVAVVTSASVLLAVPLSWLTVRTDVPFRRFWSVSTVLPLVIPSYVGAFLVLSSFGPKGLLQQALGPFFGIERLPDIYGLWGAAFTLTILSYPYVLLTVRAAIVNLDPALEESARSLGENNWGVFRRVILPQLRPSLGAGAMLVGLYTLADFGAVSLLRYETFTWAIYQQYQSVFDLGIPAALSLVLVALAMFIVVVESRTRRSIRYHKTGSGSARIGGIIRLGYWKWPAIVFCATVVAVALILPVGILGYWLMRGMNAGEPIKILWTSMANSIAISGTASLIVVCCSVPVAILVVRYQGLISRIVERLSYTGYALPGVVVALSLVFFSINFARPLYQTHWLLLLSYVVLFFPAALGAIRASLLRINPALEEASRGLGRTQSQTILFVTGPLMRDGLLAGTALVFLLTMKELPATLILSPLGFKTLATEIWSNSSEAFFAQAAMPALVLILLSALPLTVLIFRDRQVRL